MDDETIAKEIPEFISLVTDISKQIPELDKSLMMLQQKVNKNDRHEGLSFLDMKIQLLVKYLINLTYTMVLKLDGFQLADHPTIHRLVELRTIIEKIRPLEKKLHYQIDKLIKGASSTDAHHPLSFKPNINNLVSGNDDHKSESENEDDNNAADVYVPPKVTAVHFDDDNKLSKAEKRLEKSRQKSINNALLEDLREDFGDGPLEIQDARNFSKRSKIKKIENDRTRFEEDNLRRLTVTKKDKLMKRQLNELDEVVKLGNFRAMEDSSDDEQKYKAKKKKKGKRFTKRMQRKK